MWKRVGSLALEKEQLLVAQRCYAAISDVAKVNMIQVSTARRSQPFLHCEQFQKRKSLEGFML